MDLVTTSAGIEMLLRWGHFLASVMWIGLLYYFNFVQREYFKEAENIIGTSKRLGREVAFPRGAWER
jgi:uncharacterized membrane protein